MDHSVGGRNRVAQLVHGRPVEAMLVAREIPLAWYRTQALAYIVRFAPELAVNALNEARASAREGKDTYQRAAVLAWPIRAALETGKRQVADVLLNEAIGLLPQVELCCSRAEAIDVLFAAAFPGDKQLWSPLAELLPDVCPPDRHWRAARLYRAMAAIMASTDGGSARTFVAQMPEGKARQRCLREREAGLSRRPRTFF